MKGRHKEGKRERTLSPLQWESWTEAGGKGRWEQLVG